MNDELRGFLKGVGVTIWLVGIGIALWNHNMPVLAGIALGGGVMCSLSIAWTDL